MTTTTQNEVNAATLDNKRQSAPRKLYLNSILYEEISGTIIAEIMDDTDLLIASVHVCLSNDEDWTTIEVRTHDDSAEKAIRSYDINEAVFAARVIKMLEQLTTSEGLRVSEPRVML